MRIRGQSPILWRAPGESQIGAEPGHALVLSDLTGGEQLLLDRLPAEIRPDDVYRAARWSKVPLQRAHTIIRGLREAGVIDTEPDPPDNADEVYWDRLAVNAPDRAALLHTGSVAILGTGELARSIISLLVEAGMVAILPDDEALADWTAGLSPRVSTRAPLDYHPDVVVSLDGHVVDPVRSRDLARAGMTHLPVVVREVTVRVGPLVTEESPVCTTCLDLWERDADPCWPALATQLRLLTAPVIERLLLHQAAALTARAIIDVVTGRAHLWEGRSVELSALDAVGVERRWVPHPECLCARIRAAEHSGQEPGPRLSAAAGPPER
ncbi:thiamine biosynthesis protein ThiF [Actinomyces sp. MRS3W]|uniref:thiamine biosynthesis protein ThiF n=1 Tax=Actinomyces sp. MRS3W TaxID=2800796 RepID=UPI0028FDA7F9|nr:thiamine biosynthesis protein ThiF [Actinomyces sp. MRS3W]MDU0348198.1 thiamine biosynthesis protein ThiF [Actinomyces sp. MRS3W]